MDIRILPSSLSGTFSAPPSKSQAHRYLICAALADKPTLIRAGETNDDIAATVGCLRALGAEIVRTDDGFMVTPVKEAAENYAVLDCGESGSTLRFLLPVAGALGVTAEFTGKGKLPSRPIIQLMEVMTGCSFSSATLPFTLSGKLQNGDFAIEANVSSQFISGLMFALPLIGGGRIIPSTETESTAYIDMTLDALQTFGVNIEVEKYDGSFCYRYVGGKYTSPGEITVESDYSAAAFLLAGGAIGGKVRCDNLNRYSLQADREIMRLLKRFGAKVDKNTVSADELHGIEISAEEFPDLVPILAVMGVFCDGQTKITGAGRLRIKESDRLYAVFKCLKAMGADIKQTGDGLVIRGNEYIKGGKINGFNDHRIVMAMTIAATYAENPTVITGAEAINKSYPDFFRDYVKLGGRYDVVNNG